MVQTLTIIVGRKLRLGSSIRHEGHAIARGDKCKNGKDEPAIPGCWILDLVVVVVVRREAAADRHPGRRPRPRVGRGRGRGKAGRRGQPRVVHGAAHRAHSARRGAAVARAEADRAKVCGGSHTLGY